MRRPVRTILKMFQAGALQVPICDGLGYKGSGRKVQPIKKYAMLHADVRQLRQFYSSYLGRRVRVLLGAAIRRYWPQIGSDLVLGYGYVCPMLRHYLKDEQGALQLVPAMPRMQGALCWPQHSASRSVLVIEGQLPFADNVCNRIILLHALECAEDPAVLLRECWRVLAPGGRMLVIVPNRRGWWSSSLISPFSIGHPYHATQLRERLLQEKFTPMELSYALHGAPCARGGLAGLLARTFEIAAAYLAPMFGGVILMEVEKQLYAGTKEPVLVHRAQGAYAAKAAGPILGKS